MSDHESPWVAFWNRGGLWRAVLFAAVYLGALSRRRVGRPGSCSGTSVDAENVFATAQSVFVALTLPLVVGLVTARRVRLFGRLVPGRCSRASRSAAGGGCGSRRSRSSPSIVLRFLGIPYRDYGVSVVLVTLATGLLIGFAEEILTRGIVVKMMRDAGHGEWIVMVVSSLIFALLHSANILSGMAAVTVVLTVVYTFGFGVCMYLTLRVTGNLIWPMLVHGMYDPTLFLATGGVDKVNDDAAPNTFLALASPVNFAVIAIGVLGLILVRGRALRTPDQLPVPAV